MDTHAWFLLARLVHVIGGALWLGAAAVLAVFLLPSIRDSGPAGGAVMQQLTKVRRMPTIILWVSWIALLAGAYLYWHASGGFQPDWMGSRTGMSYGGGGLLGLVAALIGLFVNLPTAAKMGVLGAQIQQHGGPPTPEEGQELQTLQRRMLLAAQAIALLLLVAISAMAVADYL